MEDQEQRFSPRIMFLKKNPEQSKKKPSLKIQQKKTFQKGRGRGEAERKKRVRQVPGKSN